MSFSIPRHTVFARHEATSRYVNLRNGRCAQQGNPQLQYEPHTGLGESLNPSFFNQNFVNYNVKKHKDSYVDIEIDKLTNSIENTLTGEVFDTEVAELKQGQSKQINKKDWAFDWVKEIKDSAKSVYKLTTVSNPDIIQGLVSLECKEDHIFMHLIENAKFNKGKNKAYFGVPGNLVAFACKLSFDKGYDGFLAFDAKSGYVDHLIPI